MIRGTVPEVNEVFSLFRVLSSGSEGNNKDLISKKSYLTEQSINDKMPLIRQNKSGDKLWQDQQGRHLLE